MSRNDDRIGIQDINTGAQPPVPATVGQATEGSMFNWTCPTEIVDLPSGGHFYAEGHPLHGKDSIEIRFMTAKEEDLLTSKSLLRKGTALDRVLESVIIDKSINLDTLLVGDKSALIVASRITGYGSDYTTKVTCPTCAESADHTFELSELQAKDTSEVLSEFSATRTEKGTFIVELPMTKVEVGVRLLDGRDEKNLIQTSQRKLKHKLGDSGLLDQMRSFIISVNGNSDMENVTSFISAMPARDSRYLRQFYLAVTPGLNMEQDFTCEACGTIAALEVPLTVEFFWPK